MKAAVLVHLATMCYYYAAIRAGQCRCALVLGSASSVVAAINYLQKVTCCVSLTLAKTREAVRYFGQPEAPFFKPRGIVPMKHTLVKRPDGSK